MKSKLKYLLTSNLKNAINFNVLLIILIVVHVFLLSCKGQNKFSHVNDKFKAIDRLDNDFVTYKDTISNQVRIPKIVVEKIINLLKEYVPNKNNNFLLGVDTTNPLIFKINYLKPISLYILKVHFTHLSEYRIIAYDSISRYITINPPGINGKWMENSEQGFNQDCKLLVKPLIYFEDINNDGKNEIVIKERVHNGNIYNAVLNHYYTIDELMNLNEILCIESKYLYIFNDCVVNRSLQSNTITCEISCGRSNQELIGKARLVLSDSIRIISKEIYLKKYEDILITGSEVPENKFVREGYKFKY